MSINACKIARISEIPSSARACWPCKMRYPISSRPYSTSRTGCLRRCGGVVIGPLGSGRRQLRPDGRTPSCDCKFTAPGCSTRSCEILLVRYTLWLKSAYGQAVLMRQKILTRGLSRDTSVSMTWLPKRSRGSFENPEIRGEGFLRRRQYAVGIIATILAGALSLGETFCFAQILATPTVLGLRTVAITMCALFGLTAAGALLRWVDRSAVAFVFYIGAGATVVRL